MTKCCSYLPSWGQKTSPAAQFVGVNADDEDFYDYIIRHEDFFTNSVSTACTSFADDFYQKYYKMELECQSCVTYLP
jgi:hypothetical protein